MTAGLDPEVEGTYEDAGEFDGKRYYSRNSDWFIWFDSLVPAWYISTALGVTGDEFWKRDDLDIEGEYTQQGAATGPATVTEA